MAQNTQVLLASLSYTRGDYTALRAYCLKMPIERICDLYYSEDSPKLAHGLERFRLGMRAAPVEHAIKANPAFAEALTHARKTGHMSARMLDILVQAAGAKSAPHSRSDPHAKWSSSLASHNANGQANLLIQKRVGF
jgi:hypothetical protein